MLKTTGIVFLPVGLIDKGTAAFYLVFGGLYTER